MCSPIDPCRAGNGGCHDLVRGTLRGLRVQGRHRTWGRLALAVSLSPVRIGILLNPKSEPCHLLAHKTEL